METETIDWNNIDSVFVVDDTYENLGAPQWVDFSAPEDPPLDVDPWFCKADCKHPKTAEDYLKLTRNSKLKFLRSTSISEVLPFRDRRSGRYLYI
uniref:Uncharacterized protein n=1 Tax=Rhizophora mucronata TaxID=61149 RepID=A0A2P2P9Q3_RHIMU